MLKVYLKLFDALIIIFKHLSLESMHHPSDPQMNQLSV